MSNRGRDLHPIVKQLSPNPEQRPAVVARGRDVVVTAGAGTGKTRTLVARYLSLLAEGMEEPRQTSGHVRGIVAVTFTRKAAREMRNRIRAEVQRYLAYGEITPEAREGWQAVYAELDAARIGTIHSLCSEILRNHPAEADVDPRFRVLEEGQAGLLRREVLETALGWAADDPEAAGLFTLLGGPGNLRGVIETLLARRLDAAAAFDAVSDEPLATWQDVMRTRQRARLERFWESQAFLEAVRLLRSTVPMDPEDAMAIQRRRALDAVDEAQRMNDPPGAGAGGSGDGAPLDGQVVALSRLDEINLMGGSNRAWDGSGAEKAAVKGALRTLRRVWREHASFLTLQLNDLDERLAEALPDLRAVFRFARESYQDLKEDERAVDFDDLEAGALAILHERPTVRDRWQQEVNAILVDEFQDTNQRQRDLVALLGGDEGGVFIVGDAKQSIYRFRGADVTVFRIERKRIARSGGEGVALSTSYRAHQGLVQALNDLLRPVLGSEADDHRPWIEPFAPIEPHREEPGAGVEPPYVEFHLTVGGKADGAGDRAARALVGRLGEMIDGWTEQPPSPSSSGSTRSPGEGGRGPAATQGDDEETLGYDDVAILCRASTSFRYYEDALDAAGVPYVTVAGRGFYDRPEIRDLLNALRALSDPTDDVALVGLLRSPAVGLSDAAIYRLVQARDKAPASAEGVDPADTTQPLWDILCHGQVELDSGGSRSATRAVGLVTELHGMAGRTVVGDLLKAFLDATHYRAALLKAGQQRAVRNVDKLLNDAYTSGLVGVSAFLDYVRGLQDSGAREGEARAVTGGGVQIMSVHQAKGLEFPIVVLGDAAWERRGRARAVLTDPDLGVLLPLKDAEGDEIPAAYRLAEAREADQSAAEADRLLYVAATRAREKLLVNGCLGGIKKDGTPYKLAGWLGQLGRPLGLHELQVPYDDEGCAVHHWTLWRGETGADCRIYEPACSFYEPTLPPRAGDTRMGEEAMPPRLLEPVVGKEAERRGTKQRVWRVVPERAHLGRRSRPKAPARVVGEVVHDALAAWRLPEGVDDEPFARWLRARSRAAGLVDDEQIAHAVRRSRRLLLRLRGHQLFQILDAAEERLHEVPYSLQHDRGVESGQIDLLYRQAGVWTIVEFKTDEIRGPGELERVLEEKEYTMQARRYAAAAGQLLGARPACLLCMLDDRAGIGVYSVPESGDVQRVVL